MRSIVWTRAIEDWSADTAHFGAERALVHHLPCLRLEALPAVWHKADAYVFTSPKAVRFALAEPSAVERLNTGKVYTFGAITRDELRVSGINPIPFNDVESSEGLAGRLKTELSQGEQVIVFSASEPAYDIAQSLRGSGFPATRVDLYRTVTLLQDAQGSPLGDAGRSRLVATLAGVVCFASPSAMKGFAKALAPETNRLFKSLVAVAIGSTTLEACRPHFQNVTLASEASVSGLFAAARALYLSGHKHL